MEQPTKTAVPSSLRELPIFNPQFGIGNFIENKLPEQLKTPEAKKAIGKWGFWLTAAAIIGMIAYNANAISTGIGNFIEIGYKAIILGVVGIATVSLYLLAPALIRLFTRIGSIKIHKAETKVITDDPIPSLELQALEVDKAEEEVGKKVTEADGVRNDFISDAQTLDKESAKQLLQIKGMYKDIKTMEEQIPILREKGLEEEARENERKVKEYTKAALMKKAVAESGQETAATYLQYANEFGKAIEIIKDNQSDLRSFSTALKTSIVILDRKLKATSRMKSASEGLAQAFQIKDSWVFSLAMRAAQENINQNVAAIKNNVQFLSQNRLMTQGSSGVNREELDNFMKEMESGAIKKLNIPKLADPSYKLTADERPDKGFNIFN